MSYYIIELKGERGTRFTVKKVFKTLAKADEYSVKCANINTGNGLEKVVERTITKVKVV